MVLRFLMLFILSLVVCTVLLSLHRRKKINLELISREPVDEEKELLSVRVGANDFLFMKEFSEVNFIQELDEKESFQVLSLVDDDDDAVGQELKIPDHEKVS